MEVIGWDQNNSEFYVESKEYDVRTMRPRVQIVLDSDNEAELEEERQLAIKYRAEAQQYLRVSRLI